MKILRQVLIDTIDQAEATFQDQDAVWKEALAWWRQEEYDKWLAQNTEKWRGLRDYLTKHLRDGRPIVHDEIQDMMGPSERYASSNLYSRCWNRPDSPGQISFGGYIVKPPRGLPAYSSGLKATLLAIADDTISDHQLKQLGFANLEQLFRVAVQNGATNGVTQ
jgi:hypothetical protein